MNRISRSSARPTSSMKPRLRRGDQHGGDGHLTASIHRCFNRVSLQRYCLELLGLRPLFDDGAIDASVVTRDYAFDLDAEGGATALSVFGGKITTARKLAETCAGAVDALLSSHGTDLDAERGVAGRRNRGGGLFFVPGPAHAAKTLPETGCRAAVARLWDEVWRLLGEARAWLTLAKISDMD